MSSRKISGPCKIRELPTKTKHRQRRKAASQLLLDSQGSEVAFVGDAAVSAVMAAASGVLAMPHDEEFPDGVAEGCSGGRGQ